MFKDFVLFNNGSDVIRNLCIEIIKVKIYTKINELKNTNPFAIFKGDIDTIRKLAEQKKIQYVTDLEDNEFKDNLNFANSGLNQVMCRLLAKNNIVVCFNFSLILNSNSLEGAKLLRRMMQNVRLCRKYKVKMLISSFAKNEYELRSRYSLKSFGLVIGMNPKEAKYAVNYLEKLKSSNVS